MDKKCAESFDQRMTAAKDFLKTSLKEIMSILDAECGSFFIFDRERKELVLNSYLNSKEIDIKHVKRRVGEGISGKVVQFKTPILVRDIDMDPRFDSNGFTHYHTKSFISIPLFGSEGLIGLINIADKSTGEPFSEKDLQFAVTLCKYACSIVESLLIFNGLNHEREAQAKKKALLEKYANVGKLASGVVHEINNPLDGIIRYTNMLLNKTDEDSTTKEYLLEIKSGLGRIANITKSLLEFSYIINSESPKFIKHVHIHDLIEETLNNLKNKLSGNIQIVRNYDTGLARMSDLGIGISLVMANIIKNAADAMPGGGTLEISTYKKDSLVYIGFKDTGVGIPLELKERIFEPFFTTKASDKGSGLGLAICNEIIRKYEGEIHVDSLPQQGSTFTILIPNKYLENA